jgi:xanthine dehydrogenase YagS FAD-binding subunit
MRPFAFQKPDDLGSAIHAYRPGAYYLAGGTTLLDLMKLDVMRPSMVIDINACLRTASRRRARARMCSP